MVNILNILLLVISLTTSAIGSDRTKKIPKSITSTLSDTVPNSLIPFSSKPFEPLKLVFDYSHCSLPSEKIGGNIVSGSWTTSEGRYGWNDFVHTNTLDLLYIALEDEFQLYMNTKAISKQLLSDIDALVIFNPDNPNLLEGAKVMSDKKIELLKNFVATGGSLMVMINAVGKGRGSESFESVQLRKLVNSFGLDWNDVDTHYSDIKLSENHPYFYDIDNFHYGAGATIKILDGAESPEVLLDVYSNKGYTDRQVQGHGIVMVRPGKGKFMLVGDVGSWTGNLSRPWAENEKFVIQLFHHFKPSQRVSVPKFNKIDTLNYEIDVTGLQAIPVANSLSEIETKGYTFYKPREKTQLPYFEVGASIDLIRKMDLPDEAVKLVAEIKDLSGLIEKKDSEDKSQFVTMEVSRQGNPSKVSATGFYGS